MARADTVVWLDYPRLLVMRQIVGRTLRRLVTRQRLWNGNREPWRNLLTTDPERSIVAWAWTHHHTYQARYGAANAAHPELTFVRLRSPADAKRLTDDLSGPSAPR